MDPKLAGPVTVRRRCPEQKGFASAELRHENQTQMSESAILDLDRSLGTPIEELSHAPSIEAPESSRSCLFQALGR